jgi:hypothetical protein
MSLIHIRINPTLQILITAFCIVFTILVVPSYLLITALTAYQTLPPKFCTTDDEIYKSIVSNEDTWIEQYRETSKYPLLTLPNGTDYTVNFGRWDVTAQTPRFFVIVVDERNEPFGRAGYMYDGVDILDHRYQIRHLGEHIYCYKL